MLPRPLSPFDEMGRENPRMSFSSRLPKTSRSDRDRAKQCFCLVFVLFFVLFLLVRVALVVVLVLLGVVLVVVEVVAGHYCY